MSDLDVRLAALGVRRPQVRLPRHDVDLFKWAVIACDQHTSNPDYWREVESLVGDDPSTLHLVFPEVYLGAPDAEARIERIKATMDRYLEEGVLREEPAQFILVERHTDAGLRRDGILLAVDLEAYDFAPEARTLIRATEGTILDRLPPRIRIREGAALELPHVMLLIDDPEDDVIGPAVARRDTLSKLYDTPLMMGGGHVRGYAVDDPELAEHLTASFERIAAPETSAARYGVETALLFAVGDGNHSLATAKRVWEQLKADGADPETHPGRYALVEVVNIHAVPFEPIHRVVFGADETAVLQALESVIEEPRPAAGVDEAVRATREQERTIAVLAGGSARTARCAGEGLVHAAVQRALEAGLPADVEVDYVHGEGEAARLAGAGGVGAGDAGAGRVGPGSDGAGGSGARDVVSVILPPFDRSALFREVVHNGPLPRKVFSMGHAEDKRYYMEARAIEESR